MAMTPVLRVTIAIGFMPAMTAGASSRVKNPVPKPTVNPVAKPIALPKIGM
jgi:hypothetical protein